MTLQENNMANKIKTLLLTPVALLSLAACSKTAENKSVITFEHDDIVQNVFGGLGVEWGVYEDTDKIM